MGWLTRSAGLVAAGLLLACSGMGTESESSDGEQEVEALPPIELAVRSRTGELWELSNPNEVRLTDVLLELNGTYRQHLGAIGPGETKSFHLSRFLHRSTAASAHDLGVERLDVRCDQGRWSWEAPISP